MNKKHVLLIEDEPAIVDTIRYALSTEGIETTWVSTGKEFLLHHCLKNLLQNALNFSKTGDSITITALQTENATTIKIIDTGQGIPEYALEKIFDRFHSVPPEKTAQKSSGLGLVFVKEIMRLHNGSIQIYNNQEQGVTAELHFPNQYDADAETV